MIKQTLHSSFAVADGASREVKEGGKLAAVNWLEEIEPGGLLFIKKCFAFANNAEIASSLSFRSFSALSTSAAS